MSQQPYIRLGLLGVMLAALCTALSSTSWATPGEYALHAKVGPSFEIQDSDNTFKLGGEFDYELGFGLGFNLSANFGIGPSPIVELIPAFKYDVVYFVPGTLFVIAGAGWQLTDGTDSALAVRVGSGLRLPLKKPLEFITDINLIFGTAAPNGTPITFDWLTGLGVRY